MSDLQTEVTGQYRLTIVRVDYGVVTDSDTGVVLNRYETNTEIALLKGSAGVLAAAMETLGSELVGGMYAA